MTSRQKRSDFFRLRPLVPPIGDVGTEKTEKNLDPQKIEQHVLKKVFHCGFKNVFASKPERFSRSVFVFGWAENGKMQFPGARGTFGGETWPPQKFFPESA